MVFSIEGKVALVTGGASGIGLDVCKKLLREGVRGLTLADINQKGGEQVTGDLRQEFGKDKVIFVKTDVSDKKSFEEAFRMTIQTFKNIDILVNNAGILDDKNFEREIDVNFKGALFGMTLGIQKYIPYYKSGPEGVIMNTASVAGTRVYPMMPIYGSTKSAIASLTMAFGDNVHYERTKVRVVAIAPGLTDTNIMVGVEAKDMSLDDGFGEILERTLPLFTCQPVGIVGDNVIKIIQEKPSGTIWISENEQDISEYIPSISTFKSE